MWDSKWKCFCFTLTCIYIVSILTYINYNLSERFVPFVPWCPHVDIKYFLFIQIFMVSIWCWIPLYIHMFLAIVSVTFWHRDLGSYYLTLLHINMLCLLLAAVSPLWFLWIHRVLLKLKGENTNLSIMTFTLSR